MDELAQAEILLHDIELGKGGVTQSVPRPGRLGHDERG